MTTTLAVIVHSDTWDSRDAIARIDELETENDGAADNLDGHMPPEDYTELLTWRKFLEDNDLPADWSYGETFIADIYFESYARELAADIGSIPADYSWPTSHIDWDAAAAALKQDYTEYELAGHIFWARS